MERFNKVISFSICRVINLLVVGFFLFKLVCFLFNLVKISIRLFFLLVLLYVDFVVLNMIFCFMFS